MSRLIYGIIRERAESGLDLPAGPNGSRVSLVAIQGVAAASAAVIDYPSTSDLPSVLDFAHVVQALHAQCAILPIRFGTCAPSEAKLKVMLSRRAATFRAGLDVIEGCEEMGVRAVLGEPEIAATGPLREFASRGEAPAGAVASRFAGPAQSGTEYLAYLRARYRDQEASARAKARAVKTFKDAFAGLFKRLQAEETADPDAALLSLHFLTRRQDRERFVSAFHELRDRLKAPLLLSGPWPAYSFSAALSTSDDVGLDN